MRLTQGLNYHLGSIELEVGVMNVFEDPERPGAVVARMSIYDAATSSDADIEVRRDDEVAIGAQRFRAVDLATAAAGERGWVELVPID